MKPTPTPTTFCWSENLKQETPQPPQCQASWCWWWPPLCWRLSLTLCRLQRWHRPVANGKRPFHPNLHLCHHRLMSRLKNSHRFDANFVLCSRPNGRLNWPAFGSLKEPLHSSLNAAMFSSSNRPWNEKSFVVSHVFVTWAFLHAKSVTFSPVLWPLSPNCDV